MGRQNCFLSRAPSNLVAFLGWTTQQKYSYAGKLKVDLFALASRDGQPPEFAVQLRRDNNGPRPAKPVFAWRILQQDLAAAK